MLAQNQQEKEQQEQELGKMMGENAEAVRRMVEQLQEKHNKPMWQRLLESHPETDPKKIQFLKDMIGE